MLSNIKFDILLLVVNKNADMHKIMRINNMNNIMFIGNA